MVENVDDHEVTLCKGKVIVQAIPLRPLDVLSIMSDPTQEQPTCGATQRIRLLTTKTPDETSQFDSMDLEQVPKKMRCIVKKKLRKHKDLWSSRLGEIR